MNYTQHPLKLAIPRLSNEEINSLIFCEDVVLLTDIEAMTAISLEWFKGLPAYQRALFTCTVYGWLAKGSNQHKKKVSTRSPRYAAEVAQQVIERAAA